MISKVSNTGKGPEWMDDGNSVIRESISKSAAGSFSAIIVKRAKVLKTKGQSYAQIAKSFNITEAVLKTMLEDAHISEASSPTCSCLEKEASTEDTSYADGAQASYEAMHGKQPDHLSQGMGYVSFRGKVSTGGSQKDSGGYHKAMGTDSKPTIFDPNKLDRAINEMDNGERIRKENEAIEARRTASKNESRYQTISGESIKEALKTTIQKKANSVSSAAGQEAHKYSKKLPMNSMSMFDEKDFERLDSTPGEKMVESQKKEAAEKKEDRSWAENGRKTVTTKDIAKTMIDSIINAKE